MATFACRYARSKVTLCSSALAYLPYYFYTRYPNEKTRLWNLKNLLTPTSWFAYLITILVATICFKLFSFIGRKLGLNTVTEEIPLVPFRCLLFHRVFKNVVSISFLEFQSLNKIIKVQIMFFLKDFLQTSFSLLGLYLEGS